MAIAFFAFHIAAMLATAAPIDVKRRLAPLFAFYGGRLKMTNKWAMFSTRPDAMHIRVESVDVQGRVTLIADTRSGAQIAYVYASTALAKVQNVRWLEGKALRDVLASPVFAEWPTWVSFWPIIYAMTWGTLLFELAFPTLVWSRTLRPWLLLGGICFHMTIDILMVIPLFSWIMMVSYLAFLDDDQADRLLRRLKLGEGA